MFVRSFTAGFALFLWASGAAHACSIDLPGSKCAAAKAMPAFARDAAAQAFQPGETLPKGKYFMLMNSQSYGLPPASGGLLYFRAGQQVLRVDLDTMLIHEDVTSQLTKRLP